MNWIKIIKSEKSTLPNNNFDCLICMEDKTIFMGRYRTYWMFYFSDNGLQADKKKEKQITHWMPLPSAPNN